MKKFAAAAAIVLCCVAILPAQAGIVRVITFPARVLKRWIIAVELDWLAAKNDQQVRGALAGEYK